MGARARHQHQAVGVQHIAADLQRFRAGEGRLTEKNVHAVGAPVGNSPLMHRVTDGRPVRAAPISADPEPPGVTDGLRYVRGMHEHLRRDAPPIEAGPAETAGFDHRNPPAAKSSVSR